MKNFCDTCKFFRESVMYEKPRGYCHRYPQPIDKRSFEWCGEHKPKESKYED